MLIHALVFSLISTPIPKQAPDLDAGTEVAQPAQVQPQSPKATDKAAALVEKVQAFYEKTDDFEASFTQAYSYKAFKRTQRSSGKVAFKKPALMKWEYLEPAPKTFVLSGEKMYAHDPEAKTLTRGELGANQLSASVTFLWGRGRLADEFKIALIGCPSCAANRAMLELVPKNPDPRYKLLRLEVDTQSGQVMVSTVIDPDGSANRVAFDALKRNVGLSQESFKLSPPAGTQIIDLGQAAQGGSPAGQ
jgi:outer membrane lipoprotein carrier protein